MEDSYSFLHKDCNRDWWEIKLQISRPEPDKYNPNIIDYWWRYWLSKQDDYTGKYVLIDSGEIWSQLDIIPKTSEVMKVVANKFVSLAISVAKEHG